MAIKDFEASKIKTAIITPEDARVDIDGNLRVTGDLVVDGSGGGGGVTSGSFNVPSPANFVTTASLSVAGEDGNTATVGGIGTDVYFYVSGSKSSVVPRSNETGKIAVFGGDLVVSGTLYAERQVVEVDETVDGDFLVSGSAVISKELTVKGAKTVGGFNAALHFDDTSHSAIVWDASDAAIYESGRRLYLSGAKSISLASGPTVSTYGHLLVTGSSLHGDGKVYVNPSSQDIDFVALTDGGARLQVDAGTNTILARTFDGGTGDIFKVQRWNTGIFNLLSVTTDETIVNDAGIPGHDFRVETNNKQYAIFTDGGTNQVLILSGGASGSPNEAIATDVAFYVSGAKGSRNESGRLRGTALFGGDVVMSGALYVYGDETDTQGVGAAITLNSNNQSAIVWDSPGQLAPGSADARIYEGGGALYLSASKAISLQSGPTTSTYGHLYITGSTDNGDGYVHVNAGGEDINFTAWTDNGAKFQVDAGTDAVFARTYNGGTGDVFKVQRWSTLYYDLLKVSTPETVVNDGSRSDHDFRVETNTKTHAIFADAGTDQVLIHSGGASLSNDEAIATDVAFYVSGAKGSRNELGRLKGTALFGGDVVMSGALYVHGAETDAQGVLTAAITLNNNGSSRIVWDSPGGEDPVECDAQIYETNGGLYLSGTTSVRVKASTGDVEVISGDDINIYSGDDVVVYPGDQFSVIGPNNVSGDVASFRYRVGGWQRTIMDLSDTGVEINPEKLVTLDFKVGTDNKQHALLVSGSTDQVLILSGGAALSNNEAAGGDVAFYVSGSVGGKNHPLATHAKISVFGGDLHVSGNLTVDGSSPGGGGGGAIDVGWIGPSAGQINTTGSLGVSGSLYVANTIGHIGDSDTKISFTNDQITLTAGNREFVRFSEASVDKTIFNNANGPVLFVVNNTNGETITVDANGVVINQANAPLNDFRVRTNTKTHAFFIDADNERIGIDNPSPNELLDVNGNIVSSGFVTASMGLSGSLTRLADDTSYLIAGSGINIVSASNGAVTIAAAQVEITHHAYAEPGDANQNWIPWYSMAEFPSVGSSNSANMPFLGKLVKVVVRGSNAMGSTTIGIHRARNGEALPTTATNEEHTVNMGSANTAYEFLFTGSNHYSAGNNIAISVDPTSIPGNVYVSCVFENEVF